MYKQAEPPKLTRVYHGAFASSHTVDGPVPMSGGVGKLPRAARIMAFAGSRSPRVPRPGTPNLPTKIIPTKIA